ncbi:alpha/beta hydrolase [Celeribacter neptunius]|uniref:Acetyl esterase/lipase n=1 Tax=Celeribacter neptunius TaxID=588602 RepID=A0A1I3QIF0_9RHOB|nr:alpha/beta hydrolase [Celeribacter neptunius]SFJ33031.1 Acetyl esterase/lipase [Celeribacter neptunius]
MSFRMRLFAGALSPVVRGAFTHAQNPVPLREGMDLAAKASLFVPPGTEVRRDALGLPGMWIRPPGARQDRVILFFHGGGYIAGSPHTHKRLAWRLAQLADRAVFLPAYRLAPEHPAPAAFEDAATIWRALLSSGFAPEQVVIGGDSAGGGLTLSLLAQLCAEATPPAGAFAWSPFTDLTLSSPSHHDNAECDHFFPPARARDLTTMILGDLSPEDPRVSPLFARFPNCPPVLLQASESELLRDDSVRMAEYLRAERAQVTLRLTEGAPHVWQMFDGIFPEARQAIRETAEFVKAVAD